MRTGIVTGLPREVQCLRRLSGEPPPVVRCRGPGPQAAAQAATELLAGGCDALVSCGFAGGFDPALRPGDVVVATTVVDAAGTLLTTDAAWRQALLSRLRGTASRRCVKGRLAGLDQPLLTVAEKAACARKLAACAVDMESAAVARAAAAAGVSFLAVRVILDPANQAIPGWLAAALDAQGKPLLGRLLTGLAGHPRDLPALLRLARDERTAAAALGGVALDAGPRLARP